jgi:hypothetical protein
MEKRSASKFSSRFSKMPAVALSTDAQHSNHRLQHEDNKTENFKVPPEGVAAPTVTPTPPLTQPPLFDLMPPILTPSLALAHSPSYKYETGDTKNNHRCQQYNPSSYQPPQASTRFVRHMFLKQPQIYLVLQLPKHEDNLGSRQHRPQCSIIRVTA